ncbi:hypothetical protein CDAR_401541 [Caerostris darwini]|uniref:Uncharacterized protein n=1 Tax=Caerostris darwini TaxID=1538125 RepID=A0AAV4RUT6_9ARAC|nr:hypothetical protein CDAR_401541 [Caerostris darwini]
MKSIILDISQNNTLPDDTFPPYPQLFPGRGGWNICREHRVNKNPPSPPVRVFPRTAHDAIEVSSVRHSEGYPEEVLQCKSGVSSEPLWGDPDGT